MPELGASVVILALPWKAIVPVLLEAVMVNARGVPAPRVDWKVAPAERDSVIAELSTAPVAVKVPVVPQSNVKP